MKKTILNVMLKEHGKISQLLDDFINQVKEDFNNFEQVLEKFNRFKWTLEKHFFVEEKVLFSIYSSSSKEESERIYSLLKEHQNMLWIINKIEEDLNNKNQPKFLSLSQLLNKHAKLENEILYPKLDEELSSDQKQLIIERAEEIIR